MPEPPDPRLARFETLFTCHHDAVLRYVVRRLDVREDAADLVAETFLVAWRRLDKEFKKRHLNITLELMPGSPSTVGLSPAAGFGPNSDNIEQSEDPAGCVAAGTFPCVPQFLIPKNYSGQAQLVIARAARPGEDIQFGGPIDGRGEALQGVKFKNMRVSQVLAILKQRGYTVPEYRVTVDNYTSSPKTVPGTYFVRNGFLHKDKEVTLFVSDKR